MSELPSVKTVQELLKHVVSPVDDVSRTELQAQIEAIERVSGTISFLRLHLRAPYPTLSLQENPLQASGYAHDSKGEAIGEFLIWTEEGRIETIEWATYLHLGEPWPGIQNIVPKLSPYNHT